MNWLECSDRMDQYVIKKDGTAVDVEYFMATHVPFRDLEFLEYGDSDSKPLHLNEEQIYDQYIVNRSNKHQMLIVRGTHGSGKSHLICWLHNRFISDPVNYNPEKEKVIFLRRLRNTVRGAVQQMIDEGVVRDQELKEKFEKFTASTQSQSEEEFKATIYGEYARKAQTDASGVIFKPIVCKNIAAFLYDIRVQDYMMREGGPIDRCYQKITSGATSVVTETSDIIFTEEDFQFPRDVTRAISKNSAEEVKSFYMNDLRDDEKMMKKLADYLNHFTSGVIQGCANITSENARDLFVNLRRSLHREGKNLTIFIEDFTSFSIVESELITALSVENGGNYSDLCRVTSVIGITDGYYGSFRDNFKTRVTKQINVTEQSYGGEAFLLEMAARYLNAIYASRKAVTSWYQGKAVEDTLPLSQFQPDYDWDKVEIGKVAYTLYPFNRNSILRLYDKLKVKTTRNFLTYVIQHFFERFADGMEYKDNWTFPELPPYIESVTLQPPYADSVEGAPLPDSDKQRLKVLFKLWGDETTEADETTIGGVSKLFLKDIGLDSFAGIEKVGEKHPENGQNPEKKPQAKTSAPETVTTPPQQISKKEMTFRRKMQDITAWFEEKKTLEYASDYNKWVGDFVLQGIAWQDEGLPGDFALQRRNSGNFVDIEDSKLDTSRDRAVIVMDRTSESRTVLMGLTMLDFYGNWSFENAAYYQMVMIGWLEKNKNTFINRIFGDAVGSKEHPILTWYLAAEYLQRLLYGEKLNASSDFELAKKLVLSKIPEKGEKHINTSWNDVITYLTNQSTIRTTIHTNLNSGSKTIMGIIGERKSGDVRFFRTQELLNSIVHLKKKHWDIRDELATYSSSQYKDVRDYLSQLYAKIDAVINEEKKIAKGRLKSFQNKVGDEPTEEAYLDIISQISQFYVNCATAHESYKSELKMKFEGAPDMLAKTAVGTYANIKKALANYDELDLLNFFSGKPVETLDEILNNLNAIEEFASTLEEKHRKLIGDSGQLVDPFLVEAALSKLEELSDRLEALEVAE